MERRKTFLDVRLQAAQRLGVGIRIVKVRNGAEADRLGEPGRRSLTVDRRARHGRDLKLPRAVGGDIEGEHAGENDDRRDGEQQEDA